jgi:hypothetical protein
MSIIGGDSPSRTTSDGVLRAMPEHLRPGVAAESVVLGSTEWISRRLGSRAASTDRTGWEHSRIGPIRQYVRLLVARDLR